MGHARRDPLIQEAGGRVTTFTGTTRPLAERTDILGRNGLLREDAEPLGAGSGLRRWDQK